ncbi:MAG TPA: hypothetical protein VF974_04840 [Patescibacteria group bacterium]
MKTILFVNFSKQPFSGVPYMWPHPKSQELVETVDENCKWDGQPETFLPGQSEYMEDWRAEHLAKHLINRELDRNNKAIDDTYERAKMTKLCIMEPGAEVRSSDIDRELMNVKEKSKPVAEVSVSRGRPKKVKESVAVTETEFPGLKE